MARERRTRGPAQPAPTPKNASRDARRDREREMRARSNVSRQDSMRHIRSDPQAARKMAAMNQNEMSNQCRTFCSAVGDPATGDFSKCFVDEAHLSDVLKAVPLTTRIRGSATAVTSSDTAGYMFGVLCNPHFPLQGLYSVLTYETAGQAANVFPEFGDSMATSAPGWVGHEASITPFTLTQAQNGHVVLAYVCSELRVWNTTPPLDKGGIGYAQSIATAEGMVTDANRAPLWNQITIAEVKNQPQAVLVPAREDTSVIHIADAIDAFDIAEAAGDTTDVPNGWTQSYWFETSTAGTFAWEYTVVSYAWGQAADPSTDLIRVPGMWSCLRTAYSQSSRGEAALTTQRDLSGARKSTAKSLASRAGKLMYDHAGELLSLGASALGLLL